MLEPDDFLGSIEALVAADVSWVPSGGEKSLYLRPFMFASEAFLGVRAAHRVTYCCIASPAGSYFASGVKPVKIWISTVYTRAAPGGTGAAKCGGNYAASLIAQQEAAEHGCDQVMFADAAEHCWLEELGGMNVYLITTDGEIVTPELSGSILEGVTRDSILTLASEWGLTPVERRISVAETLDGPAHGTDLGDVRLRHGRGDHPDRLAAQRRGRRGRRLGGDRRDDRGTAQGAAGHPVRPRRGHPRLAAPDRLSAVEGSRTYWPGLVSACRSKNPSTDGMFGTGRSAWLKIPSSDGMFGTGGVGWLKVPSSDGMFGTSGVGLAEGSVE